MTTKQDALKYISDLRHIQILEHGSHTHTLPEWILIIENQLQKAKNEWYAGKDVQVLHRVAGIGACVCAAIEDNGYSTGSK